MDFGGDNYDESADDHNDDQQNISQDRSYMSSHSDSQSQNPSNPDEDSDEEQLIEGEDDDEQDDYYDSQPEQQDIIDENQLNDKDEPNEERITTPFLTKYEKARVIGVRAVQISKNSPLYYSFGDNQNMDPLSIAEKELAEGKIPFIIRRYLPNGTFEHWKLSELKTLD